MKTVQEEEGPIESRLASLLVEATPESWSAATLEVDVFDDRGVRRMRHRITHPQGRPEVVAPTEDIQSATFALLATFERHGGTWRRLLFEIEDASGSWRYSVRYEYNEE